MRSTLLVLLCCSFVDSVSAAPRAAPAAKAERKTMAVLPFTSPTRWSALGRNAQETFITTLVKSRRMRIIEASMVERMLRRRGLRWTGVVDTRLLKAAGRWLKADYLLAGKVRYTGDAFTLTAHAMDVRTLETVFAEDVDFRATNRMRVAARVLARKLVEQIAGSPATGAKKGSGAELFLNANPRAFYDGSAACVRGARRILRRYEFEGSIAAIDEAKRTLKIEGRGAARLVAGVPIDIHDAASIDGEEKILTAYVTRARGATVEAKYLREPPDGIPLSATASNHQHKWGVRIGSIVDEAEDDQQLAERFRETLIQQLGDDDDFGVAGGDGSAGRGVPGRGATAGVGSRDAEIVIEGKLYGTAGARRLHFKLYTTTGRKLLGELKIETRL